LLVVALERFESLSSSQNIHTGVEGNGGQNGNVGLVIGAVHNQEEDENLEGYKLEPFKNRVWEMRCNHTTVKNEDEPQQGRNEGLVQWA